MRFNSMRFNLVSVAVLAALAAAHPAHAQQAAPQAVDLDALRAQIAALQAQVDALQERTDAQSDINVANAKTAGCQFGVSPGFTEAIGAACQQHGLPLLPGVSTASEVMRANAAGYGFLKLFPAVAVGGVNLLKALAGPFPDVAFCPTGGISLETAPQFLSLPNVKVCGGSWLTPQDAVDAKDWARITKLATEAGSLRA